MIGYFVVDSFSSSKKDSAGCEVLVNVHSQTFPEIKAQLYLPPYLRKAQCAIAVNSILFGIIDDVTGLGFGMFGTDNSDFGYYFDSDITIKKKLTVTEDSSFGGNISATGNLVAKDCQISISDSADPSILPIVTSLATHTHTSSAPGTPTSAPIPTPIPATPADDAS